MNRNNKNELAEKIYQSAKMGIQASDIILQKTEASEMRNEIIKQKQNYEQIVNEATGLIWKSGEKPNDKSILSKASLWGSIQINTLTDSSLSRIAEIMINGTTMGIVELTKQLNERMDQDTETVKLGEKMVKAEEKHIETLKNYL